MSKYFFTCYIIKLQSYYLITVKNINNNNFLLLGEILFQDVEILIGFRT